MRHDDLALVAERQVACPGQFFQALGDHRGLGAEFLPELVRSGCTPRLGERPVHRQPQILTIHTAIFANPHVSVLSPGAGEANECRADRESKTMSTYFRPDYGLWQNCRLPGLNKGGIMHPMFVKLYLEAEADDDEASKHRRGNRARRHRSRAAVRVIARDRDRQPQRGRSGPGAAAA